MTIMLQDKTAVSQELSGFLVQIPLFIWANASSFDETTYTSYIAEKPNATRCVEPATFDNYQMVYTWNLDW
jgi:hypothetical protein